VNSSAWLLVTVFLGVAALDWAAVHSKSKVLEYLCKPGCMLALIAAAVAMDPVDEGARTALVVALALSTLGDVFLMLRGERPQLFLAGLGAFLLAHVAYVVAFWLEGVEGAGLAVGAVLALVLVVVVGRPVVRAVRAGEEPAMAGPVTAYIGVISAMVLSAAGTTEPVAVAGGVLFAGSDGLIARHRFIREAPWQPLAIIVSYHLAQALLVISFG
jgi:uncharacterized membrane protein YhhN